MSTASGTTSSASATSTGSSGSASGSTSGTTSAVGSATVTGLADFSVGDEVGATWSTADGGHNLSGVQVSLTSGAHGDLCGSQSNLVLVGDRILSVGVQRVEGTDVSPGTYSTSASPYDGGQADISEMWVAGDGSVSILGYGTGTVTLTTVEIAGSAGSFDIVMNGQDVHGTFSDVPLCQVE